MKKMFSKKLDTYHKRAKAAKGLRKSIEGLANLPNHDIRRPECTATISGGPLELVYTEIQKKIFLESTAKYVVASCGRRSGKTFGAAQFLIDTCLSEVDTPILWCDVQYNQVNSYIERYFEPTLRKLRSNLWHWDKSHREIDILSNKISFRSADRPDLLVGMGYKLLIMNEAGIQLHEGSNIWTQILVPMLLDYEDSRAFLIGTPRGFIDKTGNESQYYAMFKNASNKDPKYQCFQYSSYDNPFLKRDDIEELEKEVPPNLRLQELQGQFVNESEMQIFRPSWWQLTEVLPSPHDISKKFISIDTAFGVKDSNDESAATVWYKTFSGLFYCIHLWHDRVDYPALVSKIKELIVMYVPDNVVIENKASGQSLVQTLKVDLSHIAVTAFEPVGDKVQRATSITSFLEAGKVFLLKSHWNNDLINQATIFPMGTHDDIIDTISQALLWARIWDDKTQKIVSRSTYMAPKNEVSRFSEKSGMDISMARGFL